MPYSHLLVAVAPTPESRVLIQKAVSIARPVNAKVSLITLATDPELYNQFAAPMMENLREVMQEETRGFLAELARHALTCCWCVWKKVSAESANRDRLRRAWGRSRPCALSGSPHFLAQSPLDRQ